MLQWAIGTALDFSGSSFSSQKRGSSFEWFRQFEPEIFAIWVKFPVDVYPTRLHSHWTIWEFDSRIPDAGNSDPDKLREKAAELETLSADELLKRQMEIKVTK
jgi:hypothetical protein